MCGIAGRFEAGGRPVEAATIDRMIDRIRVRGPDDRGTWVDGPVGLGHARLSILDLEGGRQPMASEDGSVHLAYNGEIFNYLELRDELEASRRIRFRTTSDTEVLLRSWEERGERCLDDFNGQWAFAIWDRGANRLTLARDRLGIRPLFWTWDGSTFRFASEVKALFADPDVSRRLDLRALAQTFTFWCPIAPRTPFEGVHELPPGHLLTVDRDGPRVRRWWSLEPGEPFRDDPEVLAERLHDLIADATRIRLRADVPVVAYLSGGLDSTATTACALRNGAGKLETFSVTFEDGEFDESAYQDRAARELGTEHRSVRCSHDDIADAFPDVVWRTERPILRTAPAPLFLLSRLVRDAGYKVVLTGEGADEVLGGYDIFKETKIRSFWGARPESRLRPMLLRRLYPWMASMRSQPLPFLKAFYKVDEDSLASPYFSHLPRWHTTSQILRMLSRDATGAIEGYDPMAELAAATGSGWHHRDPLTRAQFLETTVLLPGYLLSSQGDRVSMAHSVEGRFPFLDYRVVEFGFRVPPNLRMRRLDEKHLLKRAVRGLVPESVVARSKQPFRAPDARSFFDPETGRTRSPWVDEVLAEPRIRHHGVFDGSAVAALVAKARAGRTIGFRDNMALVGVLSTQLLMETFVEHGER